MVSATSVKRSGADGFDSDGNRPGNPVTMRGSSQDPGDRVPEFMTLGEIAKAARTNLNQNLWDYLTGAADSEASLRRNRLALDSVAFKPKVLNDVSSVNLRREFLGQDMRIPVILPPIGSIQAFHPGGGSSVATAAAEFGTLMILSSACQPEFEEVATVGDAGKIYQLYLVGDEAWMDDIIGRSIAAGYRAFCLTVDTAVYSRRERDIHKRYVPGSGRRAGQPGQTGQPNFGSQASMSWDTVAHIKEKFDIPLVLKGIQRADDAQRAVDAGVEVVYVSNHGGRQLDHARGGLDILPEVVAAVDGRAAVVVDGGFLRGTDVVKGLCLGATAVGTGRLLGLAMAAGGPEAVVTALEILEQEMQITMGLMGVADVDDLSPDMVENATPLPGDAKVLDALPLLAEGY